MNKNSYLFQYNLIMLFMTLIVSVVTYSYIDLDVEGVTYSLYDWIETFIAIFICYFILPFINGFLLFKEIGKKGTISLKVIKRVKRLPLYTVVTLVPGYFLWHFVLCLGEVFSGDQEVSNLVVINIFLVLSYSNLVIPLFVSYMLVSNIRKKITDDLFYKNNLLLEPGITKIWQKLLVMVVIVSIFPVAILYLNGYINFDYRLEDEHRQLLNNVDLGLVAISIIISMIIITKDITDPIKRMIKSFSLIRRGDYTKRIAVTNQNEMGILTHNFNLMADGLEEREKIKGVFGQYVSPAIAETILNKTNQLDGEERYVTVLFTDIESYTSISEILTPSENVSLLNEYYELLIDIVKKHSGTVNKFMGDAIMVIFNAPVDDPKHSINAVQCGMDIVKETNNRIFGKNIKLKTRVGINSGPVIAGKLGGVNRFEYTIIGDTVNVAQRLEQFNKSAKTQLLISHETASSIVDEIDLKKVGIATVKGKSKKLLVYTTK